MNYTILTVGGKELKLRLNARSTVQLEKALKGNPLNLFMKVEKGELPTLEEVITVIHASLQALEHGYTMEAVYDLYDEYIDGGGSLIELIPVIGEIYQASGIIPKEAPGQEGK